jgi:hypothetical protein
MQENKNLPVQVEEDLQISLLAGKERHNINL